jgi:uncharacterized membrane protein YuzA (DUF378 family)
MNLNLVANILGRSSIMTDMFVIESGRNEKSV